MAKTRLHLKTHDEFAALSLHGKNDYLLGMAQQIAHVRAEEFSPLDKDSLSRIRRSLSADHSPLFNSNSSPTVSPPIAHPARRSHPGGGGRKSHRPRASSPRGQGTCRPPRLDDAQLSFFVPSIHDAPIKDDFNLMDIAPFALSKTTGEGVIRTELKEVNHHR